MPLDEARRVIWQATPKAPMGELLDQGRLTRADLQWAVSKAYRSDVRRAAQRLLQELDNTPSEQLAPPPTPPDIAPAVSAGPRVVIASTYLKAQENMHGWMLACYVALGVAAFVCTLVATFFWLRAPSTWTTLLSSIGTAGAWIWLLWLIRRHLAGVRSYRRGRAGEAQVLDTLRQVLDARWTVYSGLKLPSRRDDLDLVLVGPGGVWVVQVKAFRSWVRVRAGQWEYRRGRHWRRVGARFDPSKVRGQAAALNDFLTAQGVGRWVDAAIALTELQPADLVATSAIPVGLPFARERHVRALATRVPPSAAEIAQINAVLERRAVVQRARERGQPR